MYPPYRWSKALAVCAAIAAIGCSGSQDASIEPEPPAPAPEVRYSVSVTPERDTLPVGFSRLLVARVTDAAGTTQFVPVQWTSSQPTVVSVADGNVTAIAVGTADIVARYGSAADTAQVTVSQDNVHLQVLPSAISASLGDTVTFRAQLVTERGVALGEQPVTWTASDSDAVALVGDGQVALRNVGNADVIASIGGLTATASVNVFASNVGSVTIAPSSASLVVGASTDLDADVRGQNGRPVFFKNVTWSSSNAAVARVDGKGTVTGVSRGGAIITATSGGKSATATVNVATQPAVSITLELDPDTIVPGFQFQAVATPRDASGKPVSGRTIAYQSSNPAVATINNTGLVTGIVAGATNISAISDGNIATVKLAVDIRRIASIAIVPGAPSVTQGSSAALVADVRDQLGQPLPEAGVSWSAGNPAVATISPSGVVTGVSLGTGTVRAASGAVSSQAIVTVTSQPVASVQLSPSNASLEVRRTLQLAATALNANGQPISGASFSWSSANPEVASVSSLGVVTGKAKGEAIVTVSSGGKSASARIAVTDPPPAAVAAVAVAVNSATLNIGQSTQAVATLFDSAGSVLTGRAIAWSSASSSVASVSASGLVTAIAAGSVAISATAEGVSGMATVTVNAPPPAPVASVAVPAPSSIVLVGMNTQLSVVLKDAQGNALAGRSIAYSSSNTRFATVSSNGLVRGVAPGDVTVSVTSEGVTGTIALSVQASAPPPAGAHSVTVTLNANSLKVGQTTQATAVVKDSSGNPLSGQTITWSSSNAAVATVSSSGLVTANGAGSAAISASTSGKSGSSVMSVSAPPTVSSISVSMSSTTLNVGQSAQATAVARDAQGNAMSGVSFSWSVSSTSVLGVSSGGMVSGVGAGSAQVKATASGVTGSLAVTVNAPPPPPPPGPNGLTVPAELPRVFLNFPYKPSTGKTIVVAAGANLQNAINSAQRGDEIVLPAGATFTGNFTLPPKSGTVANGWVTIRSDKLGQLPPEGTRVTPADAHLMPKLVTPNSNPALGTQLSASGYRVVGVEITVASAYTGPQYGIVWLGDGSSAQNQLSKVATDLVLDRTYIHGQVTTDTRRCVSLNSARSQISDSYLSECHAAGFDAQAIQGHNGPGPYKIVNNTLIASTENITFGGGDPSIAGLNPSDIEIRRNYFYTPISWKGKWLRKNLFELKAGVRILVEGNVLDGSWQDGQTGWAFMLKSENQSGGCTWCTVSDITIRYNYITNSGAGFAINGRYGLYPVGALAARFTIQNNVVDNINVGPFVGDGRFNQVLANAQDVDFTNNTFTSNGRIEQFLLFDLNPSATRVAFNKNATLQGAYGLFANSRGEGTSAFGAVDSGWQFNGNYLIGPARSGYPAGTQWVSSLSAVPAGVGADQATLNAKIAGVIVP